MTDLSIRRLVSVHKKTDFFTREDLSGMGTVVEAETAEVAEVSKNDSNKILYNDSTISV